MGDTATDFMLMCECPAGGLFSTRKKAKLTDITSLGALYKAVEEALKLSVPTALEVFDEDFEEWAEPSDLDEVPAKGKVRVVAAASLDVAPAPLSNTGPAPSPQQIMLPAGVRFEIHTDVIGRGGSGVVYLGTMHDRSGTKKVAVKMLGAGASAKQRTDFVREIRKSLVIAARCEGVVLTYGAIEHAGQAALVMKLYEAGSLATIMEATGGKGLPLRHGLRYAVQIARSLVSLHDHKAAVLDLGGSCIFTTYLGPT